MSAHCSDSGSSLYRCDDPFHNMSYCSHKTILYILNINEGSWFDWWVSQTVSISDFKKVRLQHSHIPFGENKTVESSRLWLIERITIFCTHLALFDSYYHPFIIQRCTQFHNIIQHCRKLFSLIFYVIIKLILYEIL